MGPAGVALERISLGALIIALGMLVDNAIVIIDGMLVRINGGMDAEEAAREVTSQTSTPLLGATVVAIIAFAAIGLSPDSTGEFCRSLFTVIGISLSLSWVTAMTITPLLGIWFLKPPTPSEAKEEKDPYDNGFYRGYKGLLAVCIRFRWVTVAVVLFVFAVSLYGFQFTGKTFFPASTTPVLSRFDHAQVPRGRVLAARHQHRRDGKTGGSLGAGPCRARRRHARRVLHRSRAASFHLDVHA
ncbi:MAG: efflux RND transporter permease subunit [Deltaproteobacteria bacterium]|nr:efflux RND transporter permease subunit [Deltaproteobacteria bacterium]